jgi:hypothetical protein
MTELQQFLFGLVQCALNPDAPLPSTPQDMDWGALYKLLRESKLHGVVYPVLARLPSPPPPDVMGAWRTMVLRHAMKRSVTMHETKRLFEAAYARGLTPVLFKGEALAELYPDPLLRFSSDLDILVQESEKDAMADLLTELGYVLLEDPKQYVNSWTIPDKIFLEVHFVLWEDFNNETTEILDALDLAAPETRTKINLDGLDIETLGYAQHLIYQMYHIVKHMTFRGIELRHFVDTSLFVNRHCRDMDRDYFFRSMADLGYEYFVNVFFGICIHYFYMKPDALPPSVPVNEADEKALLASFLESAMVTVMDKASELASTSVYQMFYRGKNPSGSKSRLWLSMLFPSMDTLSARYDYAHKYPVLLPVAWVHRLFSRVFGREKDRGGKLFSRGYEMADKRLALMKDLKLL